MIFPKKNYIINLAKFILPYAYYKYWKITFNNSIIYKLCTLFSKNVATFVSSVDNFGKKHEKKLKIKNPFGSVIKVVP